MAAIPELQQIFDQLIVGPSTPENLATSLGLSLEELQPLLDRGVEDGDFSLDGASGEYSLVENPTRTGNNPAIKDELEEEIQNLGNLFGCDLGEELRAKFEAEGFTPQMLRDICYLVEQFPPMLTQIAQEQDKADLVDCIAQVFASLKLFVNCIISAANNEPVD